MAGLGTQTAFAIAGTSLDLSNPSAWIPPPPGGEGGESSLALAPVDTSDGLLTDYAVGAEPPPPIPPIIPPTIDVSTANAFGPDPFDANGCPILAPSDMQALATIPYREFRAVSAPAGTLPPLPEGFDVMPLAQSVGIFVESEDVFRFRAISTVDSVPVSFFGRVQRPSGYIIPFNHTLQTSTINTTFTTTPVPGKGILLGAAASVPIGSITTGQVNAVGEIGRVQGGTFIPHTLLFSGQLNDLYPLTAEGGGIPAVNAGGTFFVSSNAASAGQFKTITVTPNAGKRARLLYMQCQIINGGSAGERNGQLTLRVGGSAIWKSSGGGAITASQQAKILAAVGGGSESMQDTSAMNGPLFNIPLPETLWFTRAFDVRAEIGGFLAGDDLSDMFLAYEET